MSDFLEFAKSYGLTIRHLRTGKLSRCATIDHPTKRNGSYAFHGDWGWLVNWETPLGTLVWQDKYRARSPEEQADLRRRIKEEKERHAKERARLAEAAAKKAVKILSECALSTHPYLARKGFPKMLGNVLKEEDGELLVIPMYYGDRLCGCQKIGEGKRFLYGQRTLDAYFRIGNGKRKFICEGAASGYSLQEILASLKIPYSVFVSFSANNAVRLAKTHQDAFFIADNDESQTGQKAAEASGLPWWMPEPVGFDINDLHVTRGLFECREILRKALARG